MPIAHPVRTPRRRFPRADEPPFTASHWVQRPGVMPNLGGVPTGHTIQFKGFTYVCYQGLFENVGGAGPIPTMWWVGHIARTADGVVWQTVFNGTTVPPTGVGRAMPGMLFVRDDTLYCVVYQGGTSWIGPWVYLGAGGISIWKTTDGFFWNQHLVLVSWPSAGSGENVGGRGSDVRFRGHAQTIWRAEGSGPAGETADWLVISYMAYANVPGAPVNYQGARQYRSLDDGETWTFVRDMQTAFPYNTFSGELGPDQIFPVPREGHATDRWQMMAPNGPLYSDDSGTTWNWSSNPYGVWPGGGFMVDSGGLVYARTGGSTTGPSLWVSCDYAGSMTQPPTVPGGTAGSMLAILPFGPAVAGGEEMIAATKFGAATTIWHCTNGGETWTNLGNVPTAFTPPYGLARAPNGRVMLYITGGGGGAIDLWTCDDAPTGIPTPRSICPFVVEPPDNVGPPPPCPPAWGFTPVPCAQPCPPSLEGAEIAALLAPILARRRASYTPRFPEFTCARPLAAFVLGDHCLGVLPPVGVTTPPFERDGTCLLTGLEVFTNAPCPPTPVPGARV